MSQPHGWQRAAPIPLAVRSGWGALLLVAPGPILRLMGGVDEGRTPRRLVRILGARHIVQAAVEQRFGGTARKLGVGVDVIHAATDIAFGYIDPRWRRAVVTDAAIAATFATIGITNW